MSKGIRVTTSKIMDLLNLLIGMVRGNDKETWQGDLNPGCASALTRLRRDFGCEGIVEVRKMISAFPGWETDSLTELAARYPGAMQSPLWTLIQFVAAELEQLGYVEYWQDQIQPVLKHAVFRTEAVASEVAIDHELFGLGLGGLHSEPDITICICSQANATPARLAGNTVLVDMCLPPAKLLSSAIYELCRSPLDLDRVDQQLRWLMKDPLFQASYNESSPEFAWWTKQDYILENVRVALSLLVSERLGLLSDAGKQLAQFNESSDRLTYEVAVVLLGYLKQVPRLPAEDVNDWFCRIALMMNLGNLHKDYAEEAQYESISGSRDFEGPRRTCLIETRTIAAAAE